MTHVRPMTPGDVEGVTAVVVNANDEADRRKGREPDTPTDEQREHFRRGMHRFVERDPEGAWVAVDGGTVIGMAESIRREGFWGLSMLFVDPTRQGQGVGRRLIDAALTHARGASVRMIVSSRDPRALRRYALAGLRLHPAVEATGRIDRTAIPTGLAGRAGDVADLDLVAAVDEGLRGSRAEDVAFLLELDARMDVVDSGPGRGYAVYRPGRLSMVGATDEETAATLLWRVLAEIGEDAEIWCLTAAQGWAVDVVLAARLEIAGGGALFVSGRDHPPGPWIPSGWYF